MNVQALQPPHPNNFVVQGFQLKPETSQYVFTECAYRQGGPSSGMSYVVAGVSAETAILMSHFDDNYQAEPETDFKPKLLVN
uniref:Uncharacterized protein n=1 Tax=Ditylenchus dipsaci TaxID=166011 RepID=A0A915CVM1_9BILA